MSNLRLSYLQKVGGGDICTGHPPTQKVGGGGTSPPHPPGIYASGRQAGRRTEPARVSAGHRQTYWSSTETRTAPALSSSWLCPTPVSLLTGAGRLFQRAPPEPRQNVTGYRFQAKNTVDSLAVLKFGDFLAIHKFGRRRMNMCKENVIH